MQMQNMPVQCCAGTRKNFILLAWIDGWFCFTSGRSTPVRRTDRRMCGVRDTEKAVYSSFHRIHLFMICDFVFSSLWFYFFRNFSSIRCTDGWRRHPYAPPSAKCQLMTQINNWPQRVRSLVCSTVFYLPAFFGSAKRNCVDELITTSDWQSGFGLCYSVAVMCPKQTTNTNIRISNSSKFAVHAFCCGEDGTCQWSPMGCECSISKWKSIYTES